MAPSKRALFLDRDGVINLEKNYVHRIEDFEFVDGIFELCGCARDLGLRLVVVTNQAGIARGYYPVSDYERLTAWMLERFAERGIAIDRVYYCPFHPTAGIGEWRRESFDRKPNPGMILRARDDLGLDLPGSVLVGDKDSDIAAGRSAGVGRNVKLAAAGNAAPERLEFSTLAEIAAWLGRAAPTG
ncbi:MAG TPA: D,D-heptose 1,7-bisphosphate phosphatase, partial [Rhodocyclaceae bacterium]|nr:D,D-heptose 1,7-bisphosphate phosphatase [Rhodocyclaceae bacterium]